MEDKPFSEKIRYLYKKLDFKDNEFTKLFWDGNQKKLSSRNITVHESWLGKGIKQVKGFDFEEYVISTWTFGDGEIVFSKHLFMYASFEDFQERVDSYIFYSSKSKNLFDYKYIYYFDRKKNIVSFLELSTVRKLTPNSYNVEISPSSFHKEKGVEVYKGILSIDENYYHINVKNSLEKLTFYFVLGRGYASTHNIHGLRLGLSYDKGLPEATKELLTKEKLTKKEEKEFYLVANETEYLVSTEVQEEIFLENKMKYLNKLHLKLNNLTIFINKSRKEILEKELESDVYLNIFHKSFESLNEVSKKVMREHYYFVSRRRMATEVFLKSISTIEKSSCRIIYPLFKGDSTLFDKHDERAKKSLNLNIKLAQEGLKIERIFIVNKQYKISEYLKKSIYLLEKSGTSIKIAFIEDFEDLNLSSYDFMYSLDHSVAIYKNTRDRLCLYKVTKLRDRIKQLTYDYEKIEDISFSFEEFLSNENLKDNKVLDQLVGTWHYYAYGSLIVDRDEFRLWQSSIIIYDNGKVEYKYGNTIQNIGAIKSYLESNQSYIRFSNPKSLHFSSLLSIDHQNIYKNIFKVSMMRKQFGSMLDMLTFGIFSKEELEEELVKKALGNIEEVMLRESIELESRINELYIDSKI